MSEFIYCPRSGDRVFATSRSEGGGVEIVRWANGCRHVHGGVMLAYQASTPGRYWRQGARQMAAHVVNALYGRAAALAWDEQGRVLLLVPATTAHAADAMMRAARAAAGVPPDEQGDRENVARMILGDAAALTPEGRKGDGQVPHGFSFRPVHARRRPYRLVERVDATHRSIVLLDEPDPHFLPDAREQVIARVPLDWGFPVETSSRIDPAPAATAVAGLAGLESVTIAEEDLRAAGLCLDGAREWLRERGLSDQLPATVPVQLLVQDERAVSAANYALARAGSGIAREIA